MRTIIAGSRTITAEISVMHAIARAALAGIEPSVVISGGAAGVDTIGEKWARRSGKPIERFLADWKMFGGQAGHVRNVQMANRAEALIAVWDGKSAGTRDMIEIAKRKKLKVFVYEPHQSR